MAGLSEFEIKSIIKRRLFPEPKDEDLRKVLGQLIDGVAEAIEANNQSLDRELEQKMNRDRRRF